MKIAIKTDDKGQVVSLATVYGEKQLQVSGWQEVEADPNFNSENFREWKLDGNRLVKIASGMTPTEENQAAITTLTQENLQLQQAITELTKMQLTNQSK